MIVIFAHQHDLCASQTYERLRRKGTEAVFIDMTSDFLTNIELTWSLACSHNESFLTVNSCKISLANISSVLARTICLNKTDPDLTQKDTEYICAESYATLIGLLNFLDCRVINRPIPGMVRSPIFANREHLREVTQCGFKLPNTLVTSSYERALSFYESCSHTAVLGSPSLPIRLELIKDEEGAVHLQEVLTQQQPIYLQEVSKGQWLQVFVVGNRVFGSSFWFDFPVTEKQKLPFQAAKLSPELQERCYRLAKVLQLDFLQVQLLQTENSEVYCFDISEFPIYVQSEHSLQDEITATLAEMLEKSDRRSK